MEFKTEVLVIIRERYYLAPLEIKAIQESERAQTVTNTLISTMSLEFVQEEEAAEKLEKELKQRKEKIAELKAKMTSLKEEADTSYTSTINLIISSMKTRTEDDSWKAKIVFESGLPVYAEIETEQIPQNPDS